MKTKELVKELKETFNEFDDALQSMKETVSSYIEFVENHVDEEYRKYFGVGTAGSHSQFGDVYGAEITREGMTGYAHPDGGYFIANDFNAFVEKMNSKEVKEFYESIPARIEGALHEMKQFVKRNNEIELLIDKLEEWTQKK